MEKFTGTNEEWNSEALQIMMTFSPAIYECKKCGHPVATGYCCTYCHDANPYDPPENPENNG